jgi:hypothetical protein
MEPLKVRRRGMGPFGLWLSTTTPSRGCEEDLSFRSPSGPSSDADDPASRSGSAEAC